MSFAAAVVVFITVWWALDVLFEKKHDREYPAVKYVRELTSRGETGAKRFLKPLFVLAGAVLDETKKTSLSEQIELAGLKSTPEEILASQVVLGLGSVLAMVTVGLVTGNKNFYIAAPVAGAVMFQRPISMIKEKIKERKKAIKNELPDFIETLILLAEAGFTPYQAIKQAVSYSGGVLGDELRDMITEIEATSDEMNTMKKYAEKLQVPELRNFVAATLQASTTDSAKAREIYAQQALFMREMRVSNIRRLIKELPGKVKGYNFMLFVISVAIPIIPLVLMLMGLKFPSAK